MKTGLNRRRRGAELLLAAAAALSGPSQVGAQTASPSEVPLAITAAKHGQPARQLASNLRGDEVLLLHDRVEEGQHLAIVKLNLRQPTTLLDIAQARARVDEVSVDCTAGTRSLWRSEVYRAGDPDQVPAFNQPVPAGQRRAQPLVYLSVSDPLMAGALQALCVTAGRVVHQAQQSPSQAPQDPPAGTPAAPAAETSAAPPAGPQPDPAARLDGVPPPGAKPPHEAPPGQVPPREAPPRSGGIVNEPAFPGSAFTVRTLARLAAGTYIDPERVQKEVDIEAVLGLVLSGLNARPPEAGGSKILLAQGALSTTQRAVDRFRRELADKESLLHEVGLQAFAVPLPKLTPPGFRAELYRHKASGQYVLAFRGSAELGDWVSNVWMGVDFGQVTSPHYAAADAVVAALKRRGVSPLVVGHSLGGGMAQYVAYRHKLRAVGFNPSPLPERYLSGQSYDPDHVRLFTALELPRQDDQSPNESDRRLGDPLSLGLESLRRKSETIDRWVKANRQLVKPICLLTLPEPYLDEHEDEELANAVGKYFVKGPVQNLLLVTKAAKLRSLAVTAGAGIGLHQLLDDPIWRESADGRPEAAAFEAKRRAMLEGMKRVRTGQGAAKAAGWLYSAVSGRGMGRTAAQIGVGLAEMTAALYIKRVLQVHGMQRFVRGLGVYGDESPYQLAPDGSTPCATVASSY